jgi:four helix bundle protein
MPNEEQRITNEPEAPEAESGETVQTAPPPPPLRERTKVYALRIIRLYSALPPTTVAQVIGKQVLRAGTAVGANYREGARARSTSEMIAKFGICIQELDEVAYWLELLVETGLIPAPQLAPLRDETEQLLAILVASRKRLHQRRTANSE